jgi:valyl-tRNA synthetase
VGRRLPIIADDHVDPEFGTGALKITPGHDPADFEIGRRHGLEEISAIGEDGRMTAAAGEAYEGMTVAEANEAVVAALRADGSLRGEQPYRHSVPFSERSGERIEPLISLQWFCRMDELASPAIEVVERDEVRIIPDNYKRVYLNWMREIRPWCISRQLWWGHQIPVWYGPDGEQIVAESEELAHEAAADRGLDPDSLTRETDVLDTWFSSALWPFATLGWPDDTPHLRAFYPTSFLTTAREIIFLWVARMVMMGLEFAGDVPFRDVYVHPVVQAPDGRRMSKSLGTGIDPLDEIEVHGADALRFGMLAISSTQDVRYSPDRVQQGRDLANKLWNASRLVLLNAGEAEPGPRTERVEDRWILTRLDATIAEVGERTEEYDFSHAALGFYSFFWSEFCDWYLEIVKPRLYDGDEDAAANLLYLLEEVLRLAHPMVPFVTEEVWGYLPNRESMLLVSGPARRDPALVDTEATLAVELEVDEVRQVRAWRDLVGVPAAALLDARIDGQVSEFVARLARLTPTDGDGEPIATIGRVQILASDEIDAEQAAARVGAERERLQGEIGRLENKLGNDGFVSKAPAQVVDDERKKLADYRAELDRLG